MNQCNRHFYLSFLRVKSYLLPLWGVIIVLTSHIRGWDSLAVPSLNSALHNPIRSIFSDDDYIYVRFGMVYSYFSALESESAVILLNWELRFWVVGKKNRNIIVLILGSMLILIVLSWRLLIWWILLFLLLRWWRWRCVHDFWRNCGWSWLCLLWQILLLWPCWSDRFWFLWLLGIELNFFELLLILLFLYCHWSLLLNYLFLHNHCFLFWHDSLRWILDIVLSFVDFVDLRPNIVYFIFKFSF